MNEIIYRLYVLDKISKGQQSVEQGNTIISEELKREEVGNTTTTPTPSRPDHFAIASFSEQLGHNFI